jgi:hypothetical protein
MTRRLRTAAVSVALIAALAACSGGSSSSSITTDSSGTAAASNLGTNADGSTNDSTNASTESSTDASVTIDTNFSGDGSEALCSYATDLESSDISGDLQSGDLKSSLTKLDEILNNLKDKAPGEIKADVETMLGGYEKMIDLYKKYDYDTARMLEAAQNDPDLAAQFASISSEEITTATARVSAYFSNVCGTTDGT